MTAVTWATRAVIGAIAATWAAIGAIAVRDWWRGGDRQLRRIVEEEAPRPPAPDFAFLANCLWCADLSEEPLDCECTEGCTEVEWCVARYEHTNTSIGTIPVYREDGRG